MQRRHSNPSLDNLDESSSFSPSNFTYHLVKPCTIESPRATSPTFGFYHCQICKLLLTVKQNPPRLAIVCSRCSEATPIRKPPAEKQFYRCVCYCLLLVPRRENIFVCPRVSCHVVLVTEVAKKNPQIISNFFTENLDRVKGPPALSRDPSIASREFTQAKDWGTVFIGCGYCKQAFKASPDLDITAEILCPACKNISAVTPRFPRRMSRQYALYGLFVLLISPAITLGTYFTREHNSGIFCVTIGLFTIGIVLLLQALLFCTMPISTIISGVAGVD